MMINIAVQAKSAVERLRVCTCGMKCNERRTRLWKEISFNNRRPERNEGTKQCQPLRLSYFQMKRIRPTQNVRMQVQRASRQNKPCGIYFAKGSKSIYRTKGTVVIGSLLKNSHANKLDEISHENLTKNNPNRSCRWRPLFKKSLRSRPRVNISNDWWPPGPKYTSLTIQACDPDVSSEKIHWNPLDLGRRISTE